MAKTYLINSFCNKLGMHKDRKDLQIDFNRNEKVRGETVVFTAEFLIALYLGENCINRK